MNQFVHTCLGVLSVVFFLCSLVLLFGAFTADSSFYPSWAWYLGGCLSSLFFGCFSWVARVVLIANLPDDAFESEE